MNYSYDFAAHLTRFCRALRGHGLLVGPSEAADAVRALGAVDALDPARVYWTLRAALLSCRDDGPVFDALFERFWNFEPLPDRPVPRGGPSPAGGARRLRPRPRALPLMENDLRSKGHPDPGAAHRGQRPRVGVRPGAGRVGRGRVGGPCCDRRAHGARSRVQAGTQAQASQAQGHARSAGGVQGEASRRGATSSGCRVCAACRASRGCSRCWT